jgi:hypothetical protein
MNDSLHGTVAAASYQNVARKLRHGPDHISSNAKNCLFFRVTMGGPRGFNMGACTRLRGSARWKAADLHAGRRIACCTAIMTRAVEVESMQTNRETNDAAARNFLPREVLEMLERPNVLNGIETVLAGMYHTEAILGI